MFRQVSSGHHTTRSPNDIRNRFGDGALIESRGSAFGNGLEGARESRVAEDLSGLGATALDGEFMSV